MQSSVLLKICFTVALFAYNSTCVFSQNRVIYVDPVNGNNNRSYDQNTQGGWGQAWKDLVHALYWARTNDQIWLNAGTYYPVQAGELGSPNADRNKSFYTHSNVRIYGGFSIANGATTMGTRNAAVYTTTLSGDIQLDGNPANNSYSLIRTYLGNGFSILDGVTVTGARGGNFPDNATYGGGMYLNNVSPTISNCNFNNNTATQGGAVFCDKSNPTFTSCNFNTNTVVFGNGFLVYVGSRGGAVFNAGSSPTFNNCNFINNNAIYHPTATGSGIGAAVCNDEKFGASSPTFNNCAFTQHIGNREEASAIFTSGGAANYNGCTFENNHVRAVYTTKATDVFVGSVFQNNTGGAIRIEEGSTKVYNCLIRNNGNFGTLSGGVLLYNTKTPLPVISNCLITGNVSETGGGICNYYSTAIINNCTISANAASIKGGGGVYNISRGFSGNPSAPLYYSTSTSYQNCIIYGNTINGGISSDSIKNNFYTVPIKFSKYIPPAIFFDVFEYTYKPSVANCLIGTMPLDSFTVRASTDIGGNVLNVNPKFVNPATGNFTIDNCSRAMDAGKNEFLPVSSPTATIDLNNQPRIINGIVDMGCYEKQSGSPNNITNITINICQGQSVVINGQTQTQAGTYTRVLTAVNGCDSVINTILVVNPLPKAIAIASNNCFSTGTLDIKPNVGTAPFSVTLNSITQNNIIQGSSARFTNLNSGNYTYSITDALGCIGTGSNFLATNLINGNTIYVDAQAVGDNSGRNFANAFTDLQEALNLASCSGVAQIFVAKGTYYPSKDVNGNVGISRFATFRMINGVTIYGGFNQQTGDTTLARRNWKLHTTTLSGDIQKDGILTNNVYNIINNWGNSLNNTAVLDGFTITQAYNTYDMGGGLTLGGAMVNNGSSPTIKNCQFINNHVNANQQAFGGAIYNRDAAPIISNCSFSGNIATAAYIAFGGAVYNDNSPATFNACSFTFNQSLHAQFVNGGAISTAAGAAVTISNCLFSDNGGGAVSVFDNSSNIINSTFYSNSASNGFGGAIQSQNSSPTITNCIIWGNSNNNIVTVNSVPIIKNSILGSTGGSTSWNSAHGTDAGGNLLSINPKFNFDLSLSPCSPARNAGTNSGVTALDINSNPRIVGSIVDMGCFEYQNDLSIYGSIVYVDSAATGLNNGTSWANAFTNLSDALKLTNCAPVYSIYVSKGTYYPSLNIADGLAEDYQASTFTLRYGVSVYGGFSVANGVTSLANRNPTLYQTILSGDANKDGILENNIKAVVTAPSGLDFALLDGFTIRNGYNNTTGTGSGIFIENAKVNIANCVITNNHTAVATGYGAGVYSNFSTPIFTNCKFLSNKVQGTNAAYGAGIYNVVSNAQFYDCEFSDNLIDANNASYGAAMHNQSSPVIVSRCRFTNNITNGFNAVAGGMYSSAGSPVVVDNSLFINNRGGAICSDNNNINIFNSTIANNFNPNVDITGGMYNINASPVITNCIIYGNSKGSLSNFNAVPIVKNSLLQSSGGSAAWNIAYGTNAGGNIDVNPLFAANYQLTACSPAVNAGTNTLTGPLDLNKSNRVINETVNMGCFEADIDLSIYSNRLYVNTTATGLNNGTSWTNAFTNLQSALDIAKCKAISEIYVSKGTYYPTTDPAGNIVNNQFATFAMKNNLAIIGGFSVSDGATTIASRNPSAYPTILSAEIQQDNDPLNNAYNIINNYATGLDSTAILDGFTITNCYNTYNWGDGLTNAGAIINFQSSPKFLNCVIQNNRIAAINQGFGAGMYNKDCFPIIRNCIFKNNKVTAASNAFGAAIANFNSSPIIENCIFSQDTLLASNAVGSAIYASGGQPVKVISSLFRQNNLSAICNDANNIIISNVTIIQGETPIYTINSTPVISNSVFYNNISASIAPIASIPVITNSIIQGSKPSGVWNTAFGTDGGNNKDEDPLFNADFTLQACSPAINAGNNSLVLSNFDLNRNQRIVSTTVDMGCYESNFNNAASYGSILYVNAAASTSGDGTSWNNAFTKLQDALTYANASCATISAIYVSKGTYYPTTNTAGTFTTDTDATFRMKNGLSIIGGFSVADGITALANRNVEAYPTILSGDIQQDANQANNVYHVINNFNAALDTTAILDGFTVTGAWNNFTGIGGAVINANASPKFLNCTFSGNFVGGTYTARGAGMHNINSSPILRNCKFLDNNASGIDNAFGAGLSNDNSSPRIERSIFRNNIVNAPNPAGGGMYSNGAGGSISNSLFVGNNGTAICADASVFTLYNATIANNAGTPGLGRAGGLLLINSNFNILNSIVFGNTNGSITNINSTPTFYYCNVEGSGNNSWNNSFGINGGGNRDVNPLFTTDFKLQACSPLINAGDNASIFGNTDLDNTARIKNNIVDMGCYETTDIRPEITSVTTNYTFGSGTVTLTALANGSNTVNWYTTATDGTNLLTGNAYTTPTLNAHTLYFVEATNGSCATLPRVPIRASVYPIYYSTGNNDMAVLNNWNTASNGSGQTASSFTDTARFIVQANHNVLIAGSSNINLQQNDLIIQNNATIQHNGVLPLQLGGHITNDGTIMGSGVLLMNGTKAQLISGNGLLNNLTLDNHAGITIQSGNNKLGIIGSLIVNSGTTLNTNNALTLISNINSTAKVAKSEGTIIGNVTVQRYIPAGRRAFRFLAHPFSDNLPISSITDNIDITGIGGTPFTNTLTNNPSAFSYDNSNGNSSLTPDPGWLALQSINTFNSKTGYRILIRGSKGQGLSGSSYLPDSVTLDWTGNLNQGNQIVTLNNNGINKAYNLIGNPYASPIDLSLINRASNINANFSVWDANVGSRGAYITEPFTNSYILPSGSAFFTQAIANNNNTITFSEDSKSTNTPSNVFRSSNTDQLLTLELNTINGIYADKLKFMFNYNQNYTNDYDVLWDATKLMNPEVNIYSFSANNAKLAIDRREHQTQKIKIGFIASTGTYRIVVKDLPSSFQYYLKDNYLGTSTQLFKNAVLQISVDNNPLSQGDDRFELELKSNIVLPFNFINVSCYTHTDKIQIDWQVSSETNIVKYEVEKSLNGIHFTKVTSQLATSRNNYTWYDSMANNGSNYYRIKAVFTNGHYQNSKIVHINLKKSIPLFVVKLSPNPTKNSLYVFYEGLNELETSNLQLFTNDGKLLKTIPLGKVKSGNQTVDMQSFASGKYLVQIMNGESKKILTIVKQ